MQLSKTIALGLSAALLLAGTAEIATAHGHKGGRNMLKALDTDASETVSFAEFSARPMAMFDRTDINGDGLVTPEEREEVHAQRKANRDSERSERMEERRGKREQRLAEIDADGDGAIAKAEQEAHLQARFAEIDADGDGEATRSEMRSFMKERRKERGDRGPR